MIFPGFPGVLSFFQVFQVEWEPCAFPCKNKLIWFVKTIAHFRRQLQSRTHKVIGLISVRQDPVVITKKYSYQKYRLQWIICSTNSLKRNRSPQREQLK